MPTVSGFKRVTSGLGSRTSARYAAMHTLDVAPAATAVTVPSNSMLVHASVTSANSAHILALPDAVPGKIVVLSNGGTAFELSGAINGGSGTSTIAANATAVCICHSASAWRAFAVASDGTTAGVEAAS